MAQSIERRSASLIHEIEGPRLPESLLDMMAIVAHSYAQFVAGSLLEQLDRMCNVDRALLEELDAVKTYAEGVERRRLRGRLVSITMAAVVVGTLVGVFLQANDVAPGVARHSLRAALRQLSTTD